MRFAGLVSVCHLLLLTILLSFPNIEAGLGSIAKSKSKTNMLPPELAAVMLSFLRLLSTGFVYPVFFSDLPYFKDHLFT